MVGAFTGGLVGGVGGWSAQPMSLRQTSTGAPTEEQAPSGRCNCTHTEETPEQRRARLAAAFKDHSITDDRPSGDRREKGSGTDQGGEGRSPPPDDE